MGAAPCIFSPNATICHFSFAIHLSYYLLQDLIAGFDQEAAAGVMARLVSFKMETEVIVNLHGVLFYTSRYSYLNSESISSYFHISKVHCKFPSWK